MAETMLRIGGDANKAMPKRINFTVETLTALPARRGNIASMSSMRKRSAWR